MKLKWLTTAASTLLCMAMLAGCTAPAGTASPAPATATPTGEATAAPATSQPADAEPHANTLPFFPEKTTLTYFCNINGAMSATMSSYNEVAAFQKLEELTNVHIEWIHPGSGSAGSEQFSLMVTSKELPDLINWSFDSAKGGSEALLRDAILVPITQEDAYKYMPNYMAIIDRHPDFKQATLLDDGTMYRVANFNYDPSTGEIVNFQIKGPYMRMDWVEKVGLTTPTTIDELYTVLTAFKEQKVNGKDTIIPFVDNKSLTAIKALAGSFGTRWDMHMQNGKVVYGPITDEYRTYVTTMNKWYTEGLINSDFPVLEDAGAKILNEEAGSTIGSMGSGLTMQRSALKESNPESDLDSIPYPIGPGGHQSLVDDKNRNIRSTAITSANQHPIESMQWLDYFFSEDGMMLATFGIEGESYEIVDGVPKLTDLVMNNTSGYNQEEAIARYALGPINFPYARHIEFYRQVNLDTPQKEMIQTNWKTGTDEILMAPITLNTEESGQYANLMADIKTYVDEMTLKFIIGQEPLENFDKFVSTIQGMNIEKAISIQQQATDRYMAR